MKASISGAGLVGSLLASYLAKRGYKVDVYERRPDMRMGAIEGGRSINLALSDRGLRALANVGLEKKAHEMAIPMHGRMIHFQDGRTDFQPYGKHGQFINSISRSGLNRLLMDHAELELGAEFHFDASCKGIDLASSELIFENIDGSSYTTDSDVIFGADGAFSAVREGIMKSGRFDYQQHYLEHGYKELTIPPAKDGGFRMEKNALHIWPRKSFMLIALPNLDGSFTVTLFLAYKGEFSFENLNTEAEVGQFFNEQFPDVVPYMPNLIEDFFTNPTSSLVTIRCYPWVKHDKIALIGDAAHAIVPFYGQGMNSGFEDCSVLGEILDRHPNDIPKVLERYQSLRKPDGEAIADLALRNFVEMRDLVADKRFLTRKRIEKMIHQQYPDKFIPLYSMVTFSNLRFSEALSLGQQHDRFFEGKEDLEEIERLLNTDEGKSVINKWIEELTSVK